MPEAVIVAAARSPIGRAGKGSLVDMRPDDLGAALVQAALDQVPALDPREIEDLVLGVGQPAGESGHNLARAVAVLSGMAFDAARQRTACLAEGGQGWADPSESGALPDLYVALGHPFGMTGARITTTLLNSLRFHDQELGLETMCVGGGQGMAMVLERLS